MQDKSSFELFQIVGRAILKLYSAESGPEAREALTELEARMGRLMHGAQVPEASAVLQNVTARLGLAERKIEVLGEPSNVLGRLKRVESDLVATRVVRLVGVSILFGR